MRPRYQVSVYRTIGPLVFFSFLFFFFNVDNADYQFKKKCSNEITFVFDETCTTQLIKKVLRVFLKSYLYEFAFTNSFASLFVR